MKKPQIAPQTPEEWRVFGKVVVWIGTIVGAVLSISVGIGTLNSCVDKRIIVVVEPKLSPIADMVEYSLKANGQWDGYGTFLKQRAHDEEIKRGKNNP